MFKQTEEELPSAPSDFHFSFHNRHTNTVQLTFEPPFLCRVRREYYINTRPPRFIFLFFFSLMKSNERDERVQGASRRDSSGPRSIILVFPLYI
jgi:hypothetical protein